MFKNVSGGCRMDGFISGMLVLVGTAWIMSNTSSIRHVVMEIVLGNVGIMFLIACYDTWCRKQRVVYIDNHQKEFQR